MPPAARLPAARLALALAVAALASAALLPRAAHAASDALWQIVHGQCVPHLRAGEGAAPCAEVAMARGEDAGHAILKDRRGALQYLLIPTRRSSGIDDPALLRDDAPPYWAQAWAARHFLDERRGAPLPRDAVALAINSAWARSQDQLHIHISCVREDLRARLLAAQAAIGERWAPLARGWMGHPYQVRRVVGDALERDDPFRDVARAVPGAADAMARQSIAVIGARFADGRDGFFVMAGPVDLAAGALGSAERDAQDHDCAVLGPRAGLSSP